MRLHRVHLVILPYLSEAKDTYEKTEKKMISNNSMTQDGAIECRILQQRLHLKGKLWESVASKENESV